MITQYFTSNQINAMDPRKLLVAHDSGDGDLYVTSGTELLENDGSRCLTQALDDLLVKMRRDSFEIIAITDQGIPVVVEFISQNVQGLAPAIGGAPSTAG